MGVLPRPDRVVLLSAPQAFFGLAFGGWVLMVICALLTVTAWITVVQRMLFVYRVTSAQESTRQAPGTTPVLRPSGDAYGANERVVDGMAMAADRMVRGDDVDPRLADVAAPADAGVRRAEPGPRSSFDRAR